MYTLSQPFNAFCTLCAHLRLLQAPLRVLCPMRLGISVLETHIVNNVHTILPEVTDKKVALLFCDLTRRRYCVVFISAIPDRHSLRPLNGTT